MGYIITLTFFSNGVINLRNNCKFFLIVSNSIFSRTIPSRLSAVNSLAMYKPTIDWQVSNLKTQISSKRIAYYPSFN